MICSGGASHSFDVRLVEVNLRSQPGSLLQLPKDNWKDLHEAQLIWVNILTCCNTRTSYRENVGREVFRSDKSFEMGE